MTNYFAKLADVSAALRLSRSALINCMDQCSVQNCTVAKRCRNCHEAEKALAAIDNIYGKVVKR